MDEIEAACNAAGLLFVRYPVDAMNFPGPDIEGLGALFDDPSQSVLAYCRTGTRCANLWVTSQTGDEQAEAMQIARDIGFDLSLVRA
jgi:sulfide:quinone oxidoreductase